MTTTNPDFKRSAVTLDGRLVEKLKIIALVKKDYMYQILFQAVDEYLEKPEIANIIDKYNGVLGA